MTYLASAAQYLATWIGRANQAWGTSRVWNSGSSFEADLAAMTANRDFWANQSATWQARADSAWGPNRVWNNGTSWEAYYNAEVAAYNDMVSQMQTWQARANSAWGSSRVWGSGPSWEDWYNAYRPPAWGQTLSQGASVGTGPDGWSGNVITLTANRTGYWVVASESQRGTYTCGSRITNTGGTPIGNYNGYFWGLDRHPDSTSGNPSGGDFWNGFMSAGQQVCCQGSRATGFTPANVYLYMWFVPTDQYPK